MIFLGINTLNLPRPVRAAQRPRRATAAISPPPALPRRAKNTLSAFFQPQAGYHANTPSLARRHLPMTPLHHLYSLSHHFQPRRRRNATSTDASRRPRLLFFMFTMPRHGHGFNATRRE